MIIICGSNMHLMSSYLNLKDVEIVNDTDHDLWS